MNDQVGGGRADPLGEVGIDSGGTFTDVVDERGHVRKVLSSPDDPARAVAAGIAALGEGPAGLLVHGTTVATNALLERRGATVTLYTTAGFADVIEIARQTRPSLFDHFVDRPEPLVVRERRLEVDERLAHDGTVVRELDVATIPPVPAATDAVAVCLLHSVVDGAHEQRVAEVVGAAGHDVSISSRVAPEFREYERTVTTVLNAYLRPSTRGYLERLRGVADRALVMTSSGGVVPLDVAAELPVHLLLSGPAGGVVAATAAAVANGFDDVITFDMGGTSTDVCLVRDGRPVPAGEREVDGLPVKVPSLDIHTIGAGGGSIAGVDAGGALRVGPRSAGAQPGPACYGRGGTEPTVTDADLVAGRIPSGSRFGDLGELDLPAAVAALSDAGVTAEDVIRVVDAEMVRALRVVSIERGVDPRGLALVAFGGAGPLHACSLAAELGMPAVIVPGRAGVLSAVGLLTAPIARELVAAWPHGDDLSGLDDAAAELASAASRAVTAMTAGDVRVAVTFDARYLGQSHEIRVADLAAFHAAHLELNGYERPGDPIEVVAIRARAESLRSVQVPDHEPAVTDAVAGPAVEATDDCTVWVPVGWVARAGVAGAIVIERDDAP